MEAAFFDLDKTVIAKASMMAFGRPFYREGLVSRRTILRGAYAHVVYLHLGASEQKLARIRESVLTLTRGWEQRRVRDIVAETLEEIVEPIIFKEALELIEEHKAAGRRVFIVSASPAEIVTPLARYLGVHESISSQAEVDAGGRYTGEMSVYAYGPYKVQIMQALAEREGIDLARSYAYSDSYTDLPMLEAVGHPVAVNPDRVLLKAARERGWEVRSFVHPVRLRDRMPAPRPGPTAAVAAGVAAVAGATAVVWWRIRAARSLPPPPPPLPVVGSLARLTRRAASVQRRRRGR
jgi:HAD superfamily hydrolase (TIGR01490 family)